jgi:hypothetical protein
MTSSRTDDSHQLLVQLKFEKFRENRLFMRVWRVSYEKHYASRVFFARHFAVYIYLTIKMFNSFFSRSETRKSASLFSKFIDREIVGRFSKAEDDDGNRNKTFKGTVEYVFALVEAHSPNDTACHLGDVATIAQQNGWMVQVMVCNLVVLVNGTLPMQGLPVLDRAALVDKLLQKLPSNIKIVHGQEIAHFGLMGSADRHTYGVLLPSFVSIVTLFSSIQSGRAFEHQCGEHDFRK